MEKSGKRISSLFSLGSNASDRSSNTSMAPPSSHPSRSSRGTSPTRKPLPAGAKTLPLKTSFSHQELQSTTNSCPVPAFGPTISPSVTSHDAQSPQNAKPLPQRYDSPDGSVGSSGQVSRPESPSKSLLRPTTPTSETSRPISTSGSRPGSRAGSPSKQFHRPFTPTSDTSRPTSSYGLPSSRSGSPSKTGARPLTPTSEAKLKKHKTWLPAKSRKHSRDGDVQIPKAWIIEPQDKRPYDVSALVNFRKVPELWHDSGDTKISLHPQDSNYGPSFKLDATTFASSRKLTSLAYGDNASNQPSDRTVESHVQRLSIAPSKLQVNETAMDGGSQGSRTFGENHEDVQKQDLHIYLPLPLQADLTSAKSKLTTDDMEQLIAVRNVFAFLSGQPLVATSQSPSIYSIFLKIANFLQRYDFSNFDGSTLGEEAATNFSNYIRDFKLSDVRSSREKTLEALILGERLRSRALYDEGFVHAVGKYGEIMKLKSPLYYLITDITAKKLERADLDLNARLRTVRARLQDFDFPSLFAGIANSSSSSVSRTIRFKAWKSSFLAMRKHVLGFYRQRYGAWPPSARSKKNEFEESGLNRILLREVYSDFSDLYDALVNRSSVTTRSGSSATEEIEDDRQKIINQALRQVMDEYDRSSPPVQPPIPFDTPLLPSLATTRRDFASWDAGKQRKEHGKKLGDDEINKTLMQSYNRDIINSTLFLQTFMDYERRTAHGKSIDEIVDLRNGQWLFMYAVIQSLPLVVVDAPGLQWTKGVEYFLCETPKGNVPWNQESHSRAWYSVGDGTGMVSLPADVIDHGVDGIYRRSHCWQFADKWTADSDLISMSGQEVTFTDELMLPPPPIAPDTPNSRSGSPSRREQRQSIQFGLEALPLPPGVSPTGAKPVAKHDPSKSFDDILGVSQVQKAKKKK